MTDHEQRLADDKMRAEIAHLISQTKKTDQERQWYPAILVFGAAAAGAALMNALS